MKRSIVSLLVLALLTACSEKKQKATVIRPVKLVEVRALNVIEKSFSGVVAADQFSDLAFKVGGPIIALNVNEGQSVRKGQVIAELDPIDYKWDYEARKASFQSAESQLERAKKLLAKEAISKQEYEGTEANFSNMKAAFVRSKNILDETKLRAPFDGFIQKKYVENYQKVGAGQGVVCLVNPNKVQVDFTMPESNVQYLVKSPKMYVEFDNHKGTLFKAEVKELVKASIDGSGMPVSLYITDERFDVKKYRIAVGFSCRVVLNIESDSFANQTTIPLSSIVASEDSADKYVFVYNKQTQTVQRKAIQIVSILDKESVMVNASLNAGEKIVSAGATRMVDGQKVKVLAD